MPRSLNHNENSKENQFFKNNKAKATGDKLRKQIIIVVVDNKNWNNK